MGVEQYGFDLPSDQHRTDAKTVLFGAERLQFQLLGLGGGRSGERQAEYDRSRNFRTVLFIVISIVVRVRIERNGALALTKSAGEGD